MLTSALSIAHSATATWAGTSASLRPLMLIVSIPNQPLTKYNPLDYTCPYANNCKAPRISKKIVKFAQE